MLWIAFALLALMAMGIVIYASANIKSGIFIKAVCEIHPEDGILLTFDDGPDPDITPRVLDALDAVGMKAIFFVIGEKVVRHPEIVREIVRRGHRVGNHTMHHNPFANILGAKHLEKEIRDCEEVIYAACGVRTTLFRPPLGISTHYMAAVLRQMGYTAYGWTIRSFDTRENESREVIFERVRRQLRPGAIVLLHDRMAGADDLLTKVAGVAKSL